MKPMKVIVLIEKGPTSYGAYSPDVPGCYAGGQTREEVISLLQEALQTHIDFSSKPTGPCLGHYENIYGQANCTSMSHGYGNGCTIRKKLPI